MATRAYNGFKRRQLDVLAGKDVRALLIKTLTTTPDNPDHEFVADIAADEIVHASYGRVALTGETVSTNNTADRAQFTGGNIVFPALDTAAAPGGVLALILYVHVTNDADSWMIGYFDTPDTVPDGTDLTFTVGADGLVHVV